VGAELPERAELVEASEVCFAGDVLFAGSVGRVDLPGGSAEQMADSLRRRVLPLADSVAVLPGHGPHTTIGRERRTNPYLLDPGVLAGR
jgi:glyoxylase-like metal-dependent hydrolase (beta-lactamase superfamily II)